MFAYSDIYKEKYYSNKLSLFRSSKHCERIKKKNTVVLTVRNRDCKISCGTESETNRANGNGNEDGNCKKC